MTLTCWLTFINVKFIAFYRLSVRIHSVIIFKEFTFMITVYSFEFAQSDFHLEEIWNWFVQSWIREIPIFCYEFAIKSGGKNRARANFTLYTCIPYKRKFSRVSNFAILGSKVVSLFSRVHFIANLKIHKLVKPDMTFQGCVGRRQSKTEVLRDVRNSKFRKKEWSL